MSFKPYTEINWNRYSYTEEQLREAVKNNLSLRQTLLFLGLDGAGAGTKTVYRLVKLLNIDTSHHKGQGQKGVKQDWHWKKNADIEKVFCENSTTGRGSIKKRILYFKLIEYKCSDCNITTIWNNKPIVLHLDHINGINSDNRLENLRFLCPNCHSQTDTYTGRNIQKKNARNKRSNIQHYCSDCNTKVTKKNVKCNPCSRIGVDYTQKSNIPRKNAINHSIDFILSELKTKSRRKLAKELGIHHSTISYQINKHQSNVG